MPTGFAFSILYPWRFNWKGYLYPVKCSSFNFSFSSLNSSKKPGIHPILSIIFLWEGFKKIWDVSVCRICRMTCWLKSNRGNSAVHPRSLRKMLGAIRNIKFSDKGSISESSKPAGCSESEPISSLVNLQELPTLWTQGEGCNTCPNKNCH